MELCHSRRQSRQEKGINLRKNDELRFIEYDVQRELSTDDWNVLSIREKLG